MPNTNNISDTLDIQLVLSFTASILSFKKEFPNDYDFGKRSREFIESFYDKEDAIKDTCSRIAVSMLNQDKTQIADQIIQTLKSVEVDGDTMEYIIREVGMEEQMFNQLTERRDVIEAEMMEEGNRAHEEYYERLRREDEMIMEQYDQEIHEQLLSEQPLNDPRLEQQGENDWDWIYENSRFVMIGEDEEPIDEMREDMEEDKNIEY